MSECTHDCSTCGESCSERQEPQSLQGAPSEAHIGKVFGIVSGKGGVGKSMVTSQLAVTMRRRGHQVGILDATSPVPPSPRPSASTARPQAARRACIPWCPKPAFR
mgnify:CR=1 FL=1